MLRSLLSGYSALEGRYDELLSSPGTPRPQWQAFLRSLAEREGAEVGETLALMEREIRANGITYNVYADPKGADRPWEVDPLPLLLSASEWDEIEVGIAQRADLLNRVLQDVYGSQELMRSGLVPPSVIFGHGGFLHPVEGIRPPGGIHLFHYAADLARSPDGHWWVVNDRTQAPSGAGYALENRLVVSRVFPQLYRELHVQHLASFFGALRESIRHWAPRGADAGAPLLVLLTPGPFNETYFEHALLARYLGFALVEGSDLTVRDGCVWMKTVEGLKRVHAILRRQDDDYCDPLELRSDSALGVAGLTDCARRGTVMLANALGSGVIESGALLGYLPSLCERLLGEPLKMPSVATWWLGEEAAFEDAWKRLDHVLIKPIERSAREPAVFGADLSEDERTLLHARVAARPQRYVAQEWVHVSQAPVLERGTPAALAPRTVGLRVFAVATPDGWRVMPGGLTRVAPAESRGIAMQRGGRSKDTWVLSDAPVNASFTLLSSTVTADDLVTARANLASRAAENLFWFGRYGERCDASARLLRVAIAHVLDGSALRSDGESPVIVLAAQRGLIDPEDECGDVGSALLGAATHPDAAFGELLRTLSRVAFNLRDRMSADNWRTLNQLINDPVFDSGSLRASSLPQALAWLDRAVTSMMTISGFVLDGMTRGTGWRFLSIGRRIERLATLCSALQVATREGRSHGLDWLLELADSSVTYRARYLVAAEWLPVLDLLIRDEANPRSLAFQVKGLVEYSAKLEATHGRFASDVLAPGHAALGRLGAADLHPESPALAALLDQLQRIAFQVSDELSLKFFSHAVSRSVLSLVA